MTQPTPPTSEAAAIACVLVVRGRWPTPALAVLLALLGLFLLLVPSSQAQTPAPLARPAAAAPVPPSAAQLFREADLTLGQKLIADNRCVACHQQKVGGDGSSIYRPLGRINNPGALRGMVEQCNTELNLGLFPEEVTSVAAVLNRDHYRFP